MIEREKERERDREREREREREGKTGTWREILNHCVQIVDLMSDQIMTRTRNIKIITE